MHLGLSEQLGHLYQTLTNTQMHFSVQVLWLGCYGNTQRGSGSLAPEQACAAAHLPPLALRPALQGGL